MRIFAILNFFSSDLETNLMNILGSDFELNYFYGSENFVSICKLMRWNS
jgi:hypothetical protein